MEENPASEPTYPIDERLKEADPAKGQADDTSEELLQRLLDRRPARTSKRSLALSAAGSAVAFAVLGATAGVLLSDGAAPAPVAASATTTASKEATQPAPAQGNATEVASADAKMSVYPGWGSTPYLVAAPTLPNAPTQRGGYQVSMANGTLLKYTQNLARVLGIRSTVSQQPGAFLAGSTDGSAPSLWVSDDSMGSWSYSSSSTYPWGCAQPAQPAEEPMGAPDAQGTSGAQPASRSGAPDEGCAAPAPPLSREEAEKRARELTAALGGAQDFSWDSTSDSQFTTAVGSLEVEGRRTGLTWSFTFDDSTLVWANGFAASPTKTAQFDVVGPADAVARSHDTRWVALGPHAVYSPEPTAADATGEVQVKPQGSTPRPNEAAEPNRIQIWWNPVTVDTAEEALVQYWNQDGSVLLLPGYDLSGPGGGSWQIIGVADQHLEFVRPEETGLAVPLAQTKR